MVNSVMGTSAESERHDRLLSYAADEASTDDAVLEQRERSAGRGAPYPASESCIAAVVDGRISSGGRKRRWQ
jgi:hypothetical protein